MIGNMCTGPRAVGKMMAVVPLVVLTAFAPASADLRHDAVAIDPASWITPDDYPPAAIRAGEHGTVAVKLDIGTSGLATGCTIIGSSGSAALDAATCGVLSRRARFQPAIDEQGMPMVSLFFRRVVWQLPENALPPAPIDLDRSAPPANSLSLVISTDPLGRITACQVTVRSAPADQTARYEDACARFVVGSPFIAVGLRKGRPVAAKVRINWSQSIQYDP